MQEKEQWKDVVGYEGLYQVSSKGRVKRLRRVVHVKTKRYEYDIVLRRQVAKLEGKKGDYKRIKLYKDGGRRTHRVHVLVAEAFLGHIRCGHTLVVHHIDGNKHNNNVGNLEVITQRENIAKANVKKTSKYTGVYWDKNKRKWGACIWQNQRNHTLGHYDIEQDASDAYLKALEQINLGEAFPPPTSL